MSLSESERAAVQENSESQTVANENPETDVGSPDMNHNDEQHRTGDAAGANVDPALQGGANSDRKRSRPASLNYKPPPETGNLVTPPPTGQQQQQQQTQQEQQYAAEQQRARTATRARGSSGIPPRSKLELSDLQGMSEEEIMRALYEDPELAAAAAAQMDQKRQQQQDSDSYVPPKMSRRKEELPSKREDLLKDRGFPVFQWTILLLLLGLGLYQIYKSLSSPSAATKAKGGTTNKAPKTVQRTGKPPKTKKQANNRSAPESKPSKKDESAVKAKAQKVVDPAIEEKAKVEGKSKDVNEKPKEAKAKSKETAKEPKAVNKEPAKEAKAVNKEPAKEAKAVNKESAKEAKVVNKESAKEAKAVNKESAKEAKAVSKEPAKEAKEPVKEAKAASKEPAKAASNEAKAASKEPAVAVKGEQSKKEAPVESVKDAAAEVSNNDAVKKDKKKSSKKKSGGKKKSGEGQVELENSAPSTGSAKPVFAPSEEDDNGEWQTVGKASTEIPVANENSKKVEKVENSLDNHKDAWEEAQTPASATVITTTENLNEAAPITAEPSSVEKASPESETTAEVEKPAAFTETKVKKPKKKKKNAKPENGVKAENGVGSAPASVDVASTEGDEALASLLQEQEEIAAKQEEREDAEEVPQDSWAEVKIKKRRAKSEEAPKVDEETAAA